jgi:pyruvate/2-oxoglutarate dehydrogenase complex dihydrolipoamide dehydrogenase (E3) component
MIYNYIFILFFVSEKMLKNVVVTLKTWDISHTYYHITQSIIYSLIAVYAAGDVAAASGGPQLTPVAIYDGQIVASNLLKGNHLKPNYKGVPSVVFTIPPLASVGLQERAAKEQGLHFRANYKKTLLVSTHLVE